MRNNYRDGIYINEDENIKYYVGDGSIFVYLKKKQKIYKLVWKKVAKKKKKDK